MAMKLIFIGADHEVTGSCHYLQVGDKHILVDYGMQQGIDAFENAELPVCEAQLDYVLLTLLPPFLKTYLPFVVLLLLSLYKIYDALPALHEQKKCTDHRKIVGTAPGEVVA